MSADSGNSFTIFIETGLHAGTVRRLSPGIYTLGSELDADIVLADDGVEAIHLIAELDQRGIRLEPLQGAIAVQGEAADLAPGGERHMASPAAFAIGRTKIRISAPRDAVQSRRRLQKAVVAAGLAALAVIGFQIIDPFAAGGAEGPSGPARSGPEMPIPMSGPAAAGLIDSASAAGTSPQPRENSGTALAAEADTPAPPAISLDQAAAALRERLAAEALDDIDVRTGVDRIMVQGEALPERLRDWQAIRMWFDGRFGQDVLLVADVAAAEAATPPKLAIEAVWSGKDPYLIAGGQRFAVGAHVGDGWTIARIEAEEITFERGGKSFSLTL